MMFSHVTISVKELEESLAFYQDIVGLKLTRRFQSEADGEIVFLGSGGTEIELIYNKAKKEIHIGKGISLGFEVPSIDETITMLKEKGIVVQCEVIQPNPHIRFFFISDPNGVKIQFIEYIK